MSSPRSKQSSTRTTVNKPIIKLIIFYLSAFCGQSRGSNLSLGSNGIFDDVHEAPLFEGSAADQRAVHVRLDHQFRRVGGFDTAAVLDADLAGDHFAVQTGQSPANERVDLLRLLRRGGVAGAD